MTTRKEPRENLSKRRWKIRVPCTSANIGPGFDVLGLALSLYLTLDVKLDESKKELKFPKINCFGLGSNEAPKDPFKNLITRVSLYVLRSHSIASFPTGLAIDVDNQIPFGRGLGSSGAAVVAGVELANAIGDLKLSTERKLDYALMVERHPDNVAAALLGGFVASYLSELSVVDLEAASIPLSEVLPEYPPDADENWGKSPPRAPQGIGHYIRLNWSSQIKCVVVVPEFEVSTSKARDVLKDSYSRKDIVFNFQRLAVLTAALGRSPPDPKLIYEAMQDKIHQPYRKTLIPALPTLTSQMKPENNPGLLGICLSGAGPTILCLATDNFEQIASRVISVWKSEANVDCWWKVLEVKSFEESPENFTMDEDEGPSFTDRGGSLVTEINY
ncbi:GHMP kinase [Phakopsora pachyrhizi]|nr:GHMP kinase [Phakopsora pachyrhizi]